MMLPRWYVHMGPLWWPALADSVRSHEASEFELGGRVWAGQRSQNNGAESFAALFPPSKQLSLFGGGGKEPGPEHDP